MPSKAKHQLETNLQQVVINITSRNTLVQAAFHQPLKVTLTEESIVTLQKAFLSADWLLQDQIWSDSPDVTQCVF